jgi:GntR family transcriptional regulator, phosphonate transport system regulatory protein
MSLYAVDPSSGVSLYRQISQAIAAEVQNHYRPGMQLPSEPVLAERFSVNRHTVRHAIDELVSAGVVERRRGLGVFVLDGLMNYGINKSTRFTDTVEAGGSTAESIVLRKQIIPARGGIARRLGLPEDDHVVWIETLRKVNNAPFSVVSHFLPEAVCRAVYQHYEGGSLHDCIGRHLGLRPERRLSLITTQLPQGDDARLLGVARHQPILRVKSVNVDPAAEVPVEYCLARMRGDRVELELRL